MKILLLVLTVLLLSIAAAAQPATSAPTVPSKGYLFSPGDELLVKVQGEEQFGFAGMVDEDGMLAIPFSETSVVAKCRTVSELRADIATLLSRLLKEPQINIQVTKRVVSPVTVTGEVNRTMQVELRRKATLVEVLAQADGLKEEANGEVMVFRPIRPVCGDPEGDWRASSTQPGDVPFRRFSLSNISKGGPEFNPVIFPGDVVLVQKASPVYINGEVLAPQGVFLKEGGLMLTEAIAKVGGFRREAKTKDIRIQRRKGEGEIEYISVNYDLITKKQQPDIRLQPYDIVNVDTKTDSIGVSIFKFAIGLAKTAGQASATGTGYRILY